MPLQRFSSLKNSANGILAREKWYTFFWGRGMALDPLKRSRQRQGLSLAFHTIGVQGYFGSVQSPLSEIPGSAPDY